MRAREALAWLGALAMHAGGFVLGFPPETSAPEPPSPRTVIAVHRLPRPEVRPSSAVPAQPASEPAPKPAATPTEAETQPPSPDSETIDSETIDSAPTRVPESAPPGPSAESVAAQVRLAIAEKKAYPEAARRRRLEGTVLVRFVLGVDGGFEEPPRVVATSTHPRLDQAAIEAVLAAQTSFPALGEQASMEFIVPFEFSLQLP